MFTTWRTRLTASRTSSTISRSSVSTPTGEVAAGDSGRFPGALPQAPCQVEHAATVILRERSEQRTQFLDRGDELAGRLELLRRVLLVRHR